MQFPDDVTKDVTNRLRRAEGQLRGIQRLIDEGADCREVVTQLAATQAALHRVGTRLMTASVRHCLSDPEEALAEGITIDDMENLFLKLR